MQTSLGAPSHLLAQLINFLPFPYSLRHRIFGSGSNVYQLTG
jgi:hypothetical protein